MKKCILCGKNILNDKFLCEGCEEFLKWKHKDDFDDKIAEFKRLTDRPFNLRLTKFRRTK